MKTLSWLVTLVTLVACADSVAPKSATCDASNPSPAAFRWNGAVVQNRATLPLRTRDTIYLVSYEGDTVGRVLIGSGTRCRFLFDSLYSRNVVTMADTLP